MRQGENGGSSDQRPFRIVAHSMAAPDHSAEEFITLAATVGYAGVELICDEAFPCAVRPRATESQIAELRAHAESRGCPVVALTPYIRAIDAVDAAERDANKQAMERSLRIAASLGAYSVRVWAGTGEPSTKDAVERTKNLVESLQYLAGIAERFDCHLAIENHKASLAVSAKQTLDLVRAVGDPRVGILLDPANLILLGETRLDEAIKEQLPFVKHVHIKDLRYFGGRDYAPAIMGDGEVPWTRILGILAEGGYTGALSVEYEKRWHPKLLPEPAVGLRLELDRIQRLVGPIQSKGEGQAPRSSKEAR